MNDLRIILLLLLGCDVTQESIIRYPDGRPCATASRTPLTGPSQVGDPVVLVQGFNERGELPVVFDGRNNRSLPSDVAVEDVLQLALVGAWTAEEVVYDGTGELHCPAQGTRIEVHGVLRATSANGLSYAVPVLLSSPSDDPLDAALVLWSADVDDGREALPNPKLALPPVYRQVADDHAVSQPSPDQLGFYIRTPFELGGTLDEGLEVSLSVSNARGNSIGGFLDTSVAW